MINNLSFLNFKKKYTDKETKKKMVFIGMYEYFKNGVESKYKDKVLTIELCPNAQIIFTSGNTRDFESSYDADYVVEIKAVVHDNVLFKTGYKISDTLEPKLAKLYESVVFSDAKKPNITHLRNFITKLQMSECYNFSYYQIPDWYKEEVDALWKRTKYVLNDEFVRNEKQSQINNRHYNPLVDTNQDKERVCLLLSKVIDEVLLSEETEYNFSSNVQKQCLNMLKDIVQSLDMNVSEDKLRDSINESIKILGKKNLHDEF